MGTGPTTADDGYQQMMGLVLDALTELDRQVSDRGIGGCAISDTETKAQAIRDIGDLDTTMTPLELTDGIQDIAWKAGEVRAAHEAIQLCHETDTEYLEGLLAKIINSLSRESEAMAGELTSYFKQQGLINSRCPESPCKPL